MKQGSADDPFAEDRQEEETESTAESTAESGEGSSSQSKSLPYIYARNSVKDGRQQRPIFLRDEVEQGIPELVRELESSLGEDVYRTDVLEAAVIVAQRNPDLVEQALEEWGYGWQ